ncbi:threonine-phosphate decarboxylase CobD [Aromatoleum aromaticum]|uniref:threonine-phosphate decarboxylase CobD n=1 Tax=Aromatoleum aromaticum TaxID=551760 RepID=UPI00145996E8|nr:threonine-phosphate decarboxylase CobD [Aromatoleum aromaticum]NMG56669.1 threonine-phosphate decarboxylase [Aromatoleum aromaticum]
MLEHGGRRRAAARRYAIPEADWLDLSTGISPHAYPVPAIAAEDWLRLPEDDDGLLDAAAAYYGTARLVALAGSQPAIQGLPFLLPRGRVGVLAPTYAEHPHHWQRAGHDVIRFAAAALPAVADTLDTLVICQPNNPDAGCIAPAVLIDVAERLQARGGHLVVDEAFIDATPDASVITLAGARLPNLVVLRSLGKFFGLAGARVGFVAARPDLLAALREAAGPWPLCGPARTVARRALADTAWQDVMRRTLAEASARLARLLAPLDPEDMRRVHPLFVWLPTPAAESIAAALARQGILVRHFAAPDCQGLRFGLPGTENDWQRLDAAIRALSSPAARKDSGGTA